MKEKELQNGIEGIKKITMSPLEKERIFESILNSPIENRKKVRIHWANNYFFLITKKNNLVYYVIIPLIIILSGGGIVLASEDSLPNSIFYPVKVKVVEPVRGAFTLSSKNKAEYASNLATKRLIEAETLLDEGKLDKDTEKRLNDLLDSHTKSLNATLEKFNNDESVEEVDEITTNFHTEMNVHAQILDVLNEKEKNSSDDSYIDIKISDRARDKGDEIRKISEEDDENDDEEDEDQDDDEEGNEKEDELDKNSEDSSKEENND